ncbi:hypothetical protein EON67_04850 [archaeon]|nr:MAG: hypothetical protein EON67_04850 [archaeon]
MQRPGGGGLQPRPVLKPMGIDAGKTAELLAKIESAIDHIMLENSSHLSFEELYRYDALRGCCLCCVRRRASHFPSPPHVSTHPTCVHLQCLLQLDSV